MAIGGYKFRGFHYPARTATAGSDAEKAIFLDWFKCRLAAFKASCEASGALWRLLPACANTGATSSDDWGDGQAACIHELDDTGCNFGAFFQYGTEDKYMAMVSLNSTPASNAGLWKMNNSSTYLIDGGCDFISIDSTNPITPDNVFSTPAGRLPLRSVDGSLVNSPSNTRNVSSFTEGICYGFATKGEDIVAFKFSGSLANASITASYIYFCAYSPEAFQSLVSPSDTYKAASFGSSFYLHTDSNFIYNLSCFNTGINLLKNDGSPYTGNSDGPIYGSFVINDLAARYASTMGVIPFSAPSVVSKAGPISSEKLYAKGTLRVDLAAINSDAAMRQSSSTTRGETYGGGNYLCVGITCLSSSGVDVYQSAFYIGWDPSNPSILASTSWPDWPDAMPEVQSPVALLDPDRPNVQ